MSHGWSEAQEAKIKEIQESRGVTRKSAVRIMRQQEPIASADAHATTTKEEQPVKHEPKAKAPKKPGAKGTGETSKEKYARLKREGCASITAVARQRKIRQLRKSSPLSRRSGEWKQFWRAR